ncbi:MAG: PD-(D/E)XK nuclease family protein [Saprospiraceae bacterium]|nr:PD-(D/E)XK nuclease family protein [Saprospiraceae bacterium]
MIKSSILFDFKSLIPSNPSFFGRVGLEKISDKWLKLNQKSDQLSLFSNDQEIRLSITDFWMASMCPKMFEGYFFGHLERPPHHPILDVGTKLDKFAKKFIDATFDDREKLNLSVEYSKQLEFELRNLKSSILNNSEIQEYVNAFLDFCFLFQNYLSSNNFFSKEKLIFNIGNVLFRGQIDILVENKELTNTNLLLIDLKLQKFGGSVEEIESFEVLQVLLYALALKRKGIIVQEIGYYYFKERKFIKCPLKEDDFEELEKKFLVIIDNLLKTSEFAAKKCMLCLICPLKKNCPVGNNLSKKDFKNPLEFKGINHS